MFIPEALKRIDCDVQAESAVVGLTPQRTVSSPDVANASAACTLRFAASCRRWCRFSSAEVCTCSWDIFPNVSCSGGPAPRSTAASPGWSCLSSENLQKIKLSFNFNFFTWGNLQNVFIFRELMSEDTHDSSLYLLKKNNLRTSHFPSEVLLIKWTRTLPQECSGYLSTLTADYTHSHHICLSRFITNCSCTFVRQETVSSGFFWTHSCVIMLKGPELHARRTQI